MEGLLCMAFNVTVWLLLYGEAMWFSKWRYERWLERKEKDERSKKT